MFWVSLGLTVATAAVLGLLRFYVIGQVPQDAERNADIAVRRRCCQHQRRPALTRAPFPAPVCAKSRASAKEHPQPRLARVSVCHPGQHGHHRAEGRAAGRASSRCPPHDPFFACRAAALLRPTVNLQRVVGRGCADCGRMHRRVSRGRPERQLLSPRLPACKRAVWRGMQIPFEASTNQTLNSGLLAKVIRHLDVYLAT